MRNHRLEFLRKTNLSKSIRRSRAKREPVELIVKAASGKMGVLLRELKSIGSIMHVYESVPYLSFKCDAADAYEISRVFSKLSESKAYRSVASAISVLDVSSIMSIPATAPVKRRNFSNNGVWNLDRIGAYPAQSYASGGGISVAIIDTGVDYTHPEVSGSFEGHKGYDFIRGSFDPMDRNGHGTHVAGIAAGKDYGVSPGSRLYAVRVLDENGSGTEANAIAGLDWSARNKVNVINMSMGSPFASTALEDMCYYLANNGVFIAAAAGNNGFGPNYPAAFGEPVIAVAAVDRFNRHAGFSNIYETNDISAPGVDIVSSYNGSYASLSGTSMSAPHISGSLALALSALKKDAGLEYLLESTAERLEEGAFPERDVYGAGLVRVDRMVEAVVGQRREFAAAGYGREVMQALKEVLWG